MARNGMWSASLVGLLILTSCAVASPPSRLAQALSRLCRGRQRQRSFPPRVRSMPCWWWSRTGPLRIQRPFCRTKPWRVWGSCSQRS